MMCKGKLSFILLFLILCNWPNLAQSQTVLFPPDAIQSIPDLVLEQRGDKADVFFPKVPGISKGFPVVAVLQGAGVDKRFYAEFGRQLARYGFVVVIPNHFQTPFFAPGAPPSPLPDQFVVLDVQAQMELEDADSASPLFGIVNTGRLGLVGHSFGGAAGLFVIDGRCDGPPFCDEAMFGPFEQPESLVAGAFYGTNTCSSGGTVEDSRCMDFSTFPPNPGLLLDVATDEFPVTIVQGSLDGISTPAEGQATFDILDGVRTFISIEGANHYGITDVNNPGAVPPNLIPPTPGPNVPTIPQADAVQQVAQAMGRFLSTHVGIGLSVSSSADRCGTMPLEGATLSGNAFIFLTPLYPDGDIDQVDFFLDGSFVKTEYWASYDLQGTRDGGIPASFDTRTLDDGYHTVRAEIVFPSGVQSIESTFTTLNNAFSLSVSSSADRCGTVPLEGATLSGSAFIFLTPLYPDGDIDQVDFFLDGSFIKTEFWAPYDLKGTRDGGIPAPFDTRTLDDGFHTVRAEIVYPSGVQSVESTFTALNNESTPNDFSLAVSFSAARSGTIFLEGATLSGNAYIFLTPLFPDEDIDQVDFFLDGSFVKTESWAPYDLKGTRDGGEPAPFDTRTLDDGSHSVRAQIEFDSGEVETVASAFSVSN